MHSFGWAQRFESEGGRWGFPLKPQNTHFCVRNESFPNQILFALGIVRGADATLTKIPYLGKTPPTLTL